MFFIQWTGFKTGNHFLINSDLLIIILLGVVALAACAGPGESDDSLLSPTIYLKPDLLLDGFPHKIDVYSSTNVDKAIIFLHGGGGTKESFSYRLGISLINDRPLIEAINNDWLVANKVIAIFPQGQSTDSSYATWDNHAMLSGTDDSAFLEHISRYIISEYGISDIYLVGHSSGGIMVNRIWCERPDLFKAYISISGAASEFYLSHPCVPETRRPYLGVIGAHDGVLQVMGNLDRPTWDMGSSLPNVNFINPVVINEAFQHRYRSNLMCNEMPDQLNYRSDGVVDSWINCGGAQQLLLFQSGNHSVESLEAQSGYKLIDVITSFLTGPDN